MENKILINLLKKSGVIVENWLRGRTRNVQTKASFKYYILWIPVNKNIQRNDDVVTEIVKRMIFFINWCQVMYFRWNRCHRSEVKWLIINGVWRKYVTYAGDKSDENDWKLILNINLVNIHKYFRILEGITDGSDYSSLEIDLSIK